MVDLATVFGAGVAATFVPLYIGLFAPRLFTMRGLANNTRTITALAAASAGIIFWFFLDVMGDAALLDVNQGFSADDYTAAASHIVLALLFTVGMMALFGLERQLRSKQETGEMSESTMTGAPTLASGVALVAALGIGFHALGEGMAIGSSIPNSADIIEAIGGVSAGVAYVLHKFLEGFVIGVFALLASSVSGRKLGILGLTAGIPTVIGFFVGLPMSLQASYFFALGGAGALYIEIKLMPIFARTRLEYASIIPLLLGFYSMYIAGLFHA